MVDSLNKTVDYAAKANAFLNPLLPKAGVMAIGNNGIEFRAGDGVGFIQVPWENVVQIRAQVYFKGKYIRGFEILTDKKQVLEFVTNDSKELLKAMRHYLKKEQMVVASSNIKKIFKRRFKR
ncbi:DUF956 family protein [Vagococcus sp.]|uniref:DUF956 family protein n=1 Tax=Vagococcus sp. TaxID=1933889 RepID=UPI003F9BE231